MVRHYYFDIETTPLERFRDNPTANLEPETGKIISIQYQELREDTAEKLGELVILKEWEEGSSEEIIVRQFKRIFIDNGDWNFIPIGNNLMFEFKFLKARLNQYFGENNWDLYVRPCIDIKHMLIIMNKGQFRGYDKLLGKSHEARNIVDWYHSREYEKIENYIKGEVDDFIDRYKNLLRQLPTLI